MTSNGRKWGVMSESEQVLGGQKQFPAEADDFIEWVGRYLTRSDEANYPDTDLRYLETEIKQRMEHPTDVPTMGIALLAFFATIVFGCAQLLPNFVDGTLLGLFLVVGLLAIAILWSLIVHELNTFAKRRDQLRQHLAEVRRLQRLNEVRAAAAKDALSNARRTCWRPWSGRRP